MFYASVVTQRERIVGGVCRDYEMRVYLVMWPEGSISGC